MQSSDRWVGTGHPESEDAPGRPGGRAIVTVDEINDFVDFPRRLITVLSSVLCSLFNNNCNKPEVGLFAKSGQKRKRFRETGVESDGDDYFHDNNSGSVVALVRNPKMRQEDSEAET